MSHGPESDSSVEPNLVPLLDLVMQLLMFFMISVNFVQGVTNTGETLPHSETGVPLDADGNDAIILSVKPFRMVKDPKNDKGRDDYREFTAQERERLRARFADGETIIFIPTEAPVPDAPPGKDRLMRNMFNVSIRLKKLGEEEIKTAIREREASKGKVKTPKVDENNKILIPIHIRADADVRTGDIYELMDACKEAGYVNIRARAVLGSGEKKK